jgi:uncharacterized protein involved in outer membrane biogenesis
MGTTAVWLLILTIGVVALGAAMVYGINRNRTRTPMERAATEAATRQQYRAEDRDAS